MKTSEHFGNLWNKAKTEGVKEALKYDAVQTLNRYPRIRDALIGAFIYQGAGNVTPPRDDTGFAHPQRNVF